MDYLWESENPMVTGYLAACRVRNTALLHILYCCAATGIYLLLLFKLRITDEDF